MACNPEIVLIDGLVSGTGDEHDVKTSNLIHIKDPEDLNIDALCFRGIVDSANNLVEDNRTIIDFEVNPGFLYIGDKEYHLFSQKITDVIKVEQTGTLKLKEYPNGYSHVGLYGPFKKEDFGGYYYEELIEKQKPMYSLYLNESNRLYRYSESGYEVCYDTSGLYPLAIPPEVPLSQCFTYWEPVRKCNPLDPTTYSHDLFTNSIQVIEKPIKRFLSSEDLPQYTEDEVFYIAEYERTTLKTLTGDTFNPMSRVTREGFLVINPDLDPKIPDRVQIVDPKNRSGGSQTTIVFEAYNFNNNLIKNLYLNVAIERVFTDQSNRPITYDITSYNEYYTEFKITNPLNEERFVFENGVLINRIPPNGTQLILKTEGLISGILSGGYGYTATAVINQDGVGILYFLSPQVPAREEIVKLNFSFNGTVLRELNIRNYNKVTKVSVPFAERINYRYDVVDIRGESPNTYLLLDSLVTTMDLAAYEMREFTQSQITNKKPRASKLGTLSIEGSQIRVPILLSDEAQTFAVVRSIELGQNFISLDSSQQYGL